MPWITSQNKASSINTICWRVPKKGPKCDDDIIWSESTNKCGKCHFSSVKCQLERKQGKNRHLMVLFMQCHGERWKQSVINKFEFWGLLHSISIVGSDVSIKLLFPKLNPLKIEDGELIKSLSNWPFILHQIILSYVYRPTVNPNGQCRKGSDSLLAFIQMFRQT